jgi:hypothetical protein
VNRRRGEWAVPEVDAAGNAVNTVDPQLDPVHFEMCLAKWQCDTATLEVFPAGGEVNPAGF